jgi:hypothetical protein
MNTFRFRLSSGTDHNGRRIESASFTAYGETFSEAQASARRQLASWEDCQPLYGPAERCGLPFC